jgi:hypothetical protein
MIYFKKGKIFISFAGYLLGHLLAPYVGYPPEAGYTGFGCGSFPALGTCGQGYLLLGTRVVF